MRGRAQDVEQGRRVSIVAGKAERTTAHPDIERFLKAEHMILVPDADRAGAADIDDRRFAAVEKALRACLGNPVDHEPVRRRHHAADDHAVKMAIGEVGSARLEKRFDDEAVAQALRVAPCGILWPDHLAN